MKSDVKIVVVGDEKVGKTSIIASLMHESFQSEVPSVIPEVQIAPEVIVDRVSTRIIDTSSRKVDNKQTEKAITSADVICIVYDVSNGEGLNRVEDYWIPEIRKLQDYADKDVYVPLVVVGNKIDTRASEFNTDLKSESFHINIKPIMKRFAEVELCMECSALNFLNISQVFYHAQRAVLYPSAILYNSDEQQLTKEYIQALKRIFKICDEDNDNNLNMTELNEFQIKSFNAPLETAELEGVVDFVKNGYQEGAAEGNQGLTEGGFLYLHSLFLKKGKLETVWTVLRKFGYEDDLTLKEDFLCPMMEVNEDEVVELSESGIEFFTKIFQKYDTENKGYLTQEQLEELFQTTPTGQPWGDNFPEHTTHTNSGQITLQGFLAQWSVTTLLDFEITLRHLAFLGFEAMQHNGDTRKALEIKKRRTDEKHRNIFHCYVLGTQGSGKTSVLRSLIGQETKSKDLNQYSPYTTNAVDVESDGDKYLALSEISENQCQPDSDFFNDVSKVEACDVFCLLFDVTDAWSWEFATKTHKKILESFPHIPCIFFGTKHDLKKAEISKIPSQYCSNLEIPQPRYVNASNAKDNQDMFSHLVYSVLRRNLVLPNHSEKSGFGVSKTTAGLLFGGLVLVFGGGYIIKSTPFLENLSKNLNALKN